MRHTDSLNTTIPTSALQSAETQAGRSPQPAFAALSGERPANSFLPPAPFAGSQAPAGQLAESSLTPNGDGSADSFDWRAYFHARHKAARARMMVCQKPRQIESAPPAPKTEEPIVYAPPTRKHQVVVIASGFWGYHRLDQSHTAKTGLQVLADVSAETGISIAEIKGRSRNGAIASARQLAMYEIRKQCPHLSMPQIGRMLGGRDHTTVLHAVRKLERQRGAFLPPEKPKPKPPEPVAPTPPEWLGAAAELWRNGLATDEIARDLSVQESSVWSNLSVIRLMARAS